MMLTRTALGLRPLVLCVGLLLASCATGPGYERPQSPVPANWTAGEADARWPALDWWTSFNDPILDELVRTALRNNYDLGAALERVAQARAQLRVAGAALSPSVAADAEIAREKSSNNSAIQRSREPITSYDVGLTASYQVDLFGGNRALKDAAIAGLKGSEFDRQTVALSIAAATVSTYLQLSALDRRLELSRSTLAAARETLGLVRAQLKEGRATVGDVAQQSAEVARLEAAVPPIATEREQSKNALSILVGSLPEAFHVNPTPIDRLTIPTPPAGLPSSLLSHRPDVMRAEAALSGGNANVRAAAAALLPRINLTVQGGFSSLALTELFAPGNLFYNLAAGLTAPLFDGGKLKGELALSEARYRELVQNYQKAVFSAFADVENALTAQGNATTTAVASEARVVASAEAARISRLRYVEGMADYLTVLETQRALLTARDAEVQARLNQLNAKVSVYQALGGGWGSLDESTGTAQ